MFLEPPLHFTSLFVHLSPHICHMINTRRDTARTHRCPVGLVISVARSGIKEPLSVLRKVWPTHEHVDYTVYIYIQLTRFVGELIRVVVLV